MLHGLRDLRNLRRTECADLGNPPTESERLDAWHDPDGREQQHLFPPSPDPDAVPAPPTPESVSPQQPVRNPDSSSSRVSAVRFRGSSGRFLPQSDSHQSAHDKSADSPRMQNEPGCSSRDGQPIRVDAPDHAVIPGDVEMQGEEFEVGADDPNFQRVPDHPSDENPPVASQSPQSSEPRLPHPRRRITSQQFERNVRARQSTSSLHPVPSSEAALAFSADSLEPACSRRIDNGKKVGVEVSYPVTADIFENPEDDWLAAASSRARARVEVNIKKRSADERAQFRAAQDKQIDQWISNDVISVCQRAGIPKHRVMTMRWVHTWRVDENTGETKGKSPPCCERLH